MPPIRRPIGKKKGPSKEELERLAREAELKRIRQELLTAETEAEKFQHQHDLDRDDHDASAAFRVQRELEQRQLFDQQQVIDKLTLKMGNLQTELETERSDTDRELARLRGLVERSHNDLSTSRKESYESEQSMREDRDRVIDQNVALETQLAKARAKIHVLTDQVEKLEASASEEIRQLKSQLSSANEMANRSEQEHEFRHRHMLREAEKAKVLTSTMQEALATRETEDKKNTELLKLMNTQLDESKRRQQEFLEDERRRTREAVAELTTLQATSTSIKEENTLLKQELEQTKKDCAKFLEALEESKTFTKLWRDESRAELDRVKGGASKDLDDAMQRSVRQANDVATLKGMLEASKKQVADLEDLLRRKERQTAERIAFLNAQIASERAIIQELLEKIQEQKKLFEETTVAYELSSREKQNEIAEYSRTVLQLQQDSKKDREEAVRIRQANDEHFRGRIQDLESTMKRQNNLQVAHVTNQTELDVAMSEIARLETILDQHFIDHRNYKPAKKTQQQQQQPRPPSGAGASPSSPSPATSGGRRAGAVTSATSKRQDGTTATAADTTNNNNSDLLRDENEALKLKLEKVLTDQEQHRRISLEVEARLQSQVKNQYEVVDALNAQLTEERKSMLDKIQRLEREKQELIMSLPTSPERKKWRK